MGLLHWQEMLSQTVGWTRVVAEYKVRQEQLFSLDEFKFGIALRVPGQQPAPQFGAFHLVLLPDDFHGVFVHFITETKTIHGLVRPTISLPPFMQVAEDDK